MKKYISIVAAMVLMLFSLSACNHQESETTTEPSRKEEAQSEKIQIVTTIFPEYDWVKQILGEDAENAEVTLLLDTGVDLHSYQPTAEDILKISGCDLFLYVGGESDEWVEDALNNPSNENRKVVNLLEVLGDAAKEEEMVEGMEEGEDHEEDGEEEEEGPEYDEHVWLSLKNARIFCEAIEKELAELCPEKAEQYEENKKNYEEKLEALDGKFRETVDAASNKTLLFGDRFPFRYLTEDYGLSYYAAFVGCSAETEASFQTVTFLSGKVDELNLSTVLILEKSDGKIAKTIVENTQKKDQKIVSMDSMQSVTAAEVEEGVSYLSIMEKNLDAMKAALE
ncbi:MAG: metal ABC transporter substrate-binding protein [Eubacteriales bacterium]|nr:metal ABC transporter substrate-binding protein [Eubacteriales bacterium]